MKLVNSTLFIIFVITAIFSTLSAQTDERKLAEILMFGKPFYKQNTEFEWEYYDAIAEENNSIEKLENKELSLTYQNIIGKEMIIEYDLFTVEIMITTDSTLSWKDYKSKKINNEKTKTIHIDNKTILKSWLEVDNTLVVMFADFYQGDTHSILYKNDGNIELANGSIKLKD
ncbi:MAG: hypothetical protein IPH62_07555 [Ignavibacteriae bacterium]|nr:hypothetical protein [Ignavibacteriota bacterium]